MRIRAIALTVAAAAVAVLVLGGEAPSGKMRPETTKPPAPREGEREIRAALEPLREHQGAARGTGPIAFGRSALGRRLSVTAGGNPGSRRRILVVGCIHGTECAGMAVTRRVFPGCPPPHADVWVVRSLNPDGRTLGTRLNGRGVDLNRNFPAGWRSMGLPWSPQYSGPRPFSEPETRAAARLIRLIRPDVTIWFHQQSQALVRAWAGSVPAARRYARAAGLPFHRMRWLAGTAPQWQNRRFRGASSFVVELPPGRLSARAARRHAVAIERVALRGSIGRDR